MQQPQSQPLSVIALISGGKDSLYSILHCIRNGHKVAALANLHPPVPGAGQGPDEAPREPEDDMDSYMYQTIGHNVIPLYEEALGIPLYRAPISGTAVSTAREYHNSDGDETEDLIPLLQRIKADHPSANAVSAGAILSTYQRTRIENVAGRLGLTPLAWLWMYPTLPDPKERRMAISPKPQPPAIGGLLDDMAACGCEARIVKVASGGLGEEMLWGDVSSPDGKMRRLIAKTMKRYGADGLGGSVVGEGGEYETLAVDGPAFLWKRKIAVDESDREIRTGDGGVGYVRIKAAKCADKHQPAGEYTSGSVRVPWPFDHDFQRLYDGLEPLTENGSAKDEGKQEEPSRYPEWKILPSQSHGAFTWTVSNISAPEAGSTAGAQMKGIAQQLDHILQSGSEDGKSTDDIVFATVLIRSMTDFASINAEYAKLFNKPSPPARATVACGNSLPQGVDIMASFVIDMGPRKTRNGLHVQSRSYWAPANIGPYSQAITVPFQHDANADAAGGLVYIAGQIPLDPASMNLARAPTNDKLEPWLNAFGMQTVLSLQHLWRIARATEVDWWMNGIAFLSGNDRIQSKARVAWDTWAHMNRDRTDVEEEEDEDESASTFDVWDIKYGRQDADYTAVGKTLPNFDVIKERKATLTPPFLAVQVDQLPRGSDIEWQCLGARGDRVTQTRAHDDAAGVSATHSHARGGQDDGAVVCCLGVERPSSLPRLKSLIAEAVQRAVPEGWDSDGAEIHTVLYTGYQYPLFHGQDQDLQELDAQIVPCRSVWAAKGQELAAAVVVLLRNSGA